MAPNLQEKLTIDLLRNESVLRAFREACRDTPLFADSDWKHPHLSTTKTDQLFFQGEGQWDWQEVFHRFHEQAQGGNDKKENYHLQSAPDWMRWSTTNRKAYAKHLPILMEALRGMPVCVSLSFGWTWLRGNKSERPNGKPQRLHEFQLLLSFHDRYKFEPDVFLKAHGEVCESNDPRADRCLFEVAEDMGQPIGGGGYQWTKVGFNLRVWSKAQALSLKNLFVDCQIELQREKCSTGVSWTLATSFPK